MQVGDYYSKGPKIPATRIQSPRKTVSNMNRETCRPNFPIGSYTYRILGRDPSKVPSNYVFFYTQPNEYGDFVVFKDPTTNAWSVFMNLTPEEERIFKQALDTNTPILGTFRFIIDAKSKIVHQLAYLFARDPTAPDRLVLSIFEPYDTTAVWMKGDESWIDGIHSWFKERLKDVIPGVKRIGIQTLLSPGTDFQKNDPASGRCIVWAFVFLSFLKDMDLRTATEADYDALYARLAAQLEEKDGYDRLLSQFYGASRRKTRRTKFLRRGHNEQSILASSRRSRRGRTRA